MTRKSHPLARLRQAFLLLAMALPAAEVLAAPLDDMRVLVEGGQFERAYATATQNPQLIGDVHFDFLYGLAAIATGHVPEGLLALERHLAAVPANDRARLELARGYFLIGEYERARSEFEFVLRYNPPAGVRSNIARYLEAMDLRDNSQGRSSSRLYAEVGGGHDSNVNGGTFRDELQFQFGTVSLAGSASQGVPDDFVQVAAGGQKTLRVSNRLSVFASVDLDDKQNFHQRDYDLANIGASVGFSLISGRVLYRGTLGTSTLLVGNNRYRDTNSLGGEANLTLGPSLSLMLFTQYAEFHYTGADIVRDARATTLGAMLTRNFSDLPGAPSAGVRFSWTQEDNLQQRPDLSRHVPLLRLFGAVSPAESWRIAAGLTVYGQQYGAEDLAFGTTRSDTTTSIDLSATYAISPGWTVRGEWLGFVNRSNQDLYDSRRQTAAVKLRYQY